MILSKTVLSNNRFKIALAVSIIVTSLFALTLAKLFSSERILRDYQKSSKYEEAISRSNQEKSATLDRYIKNPELLPNKDTFIQILYPSIVHHAVTTNTNPTIIGRITNYSVPFIETEFRNDEARNGIANLGKNQYYLRFLPGELHNIRVDLRAITKASSASYRTTSLYGFTEIPYISCESLSPNPDGSLSRNDDRTSPNITEYTDRDDCIENKRNSLPAILFFIKFQKELEPGSYELIITIHDRDVADIQKFTYTFAVNPDFRLNYNPFTSIPAVQKQLFGDFCSGHYGFSSPEEKESYLEIPLPKIHSADVNYRIVFPQTLEETIKGHQDRIAYIQV